MTAVAPLPGNARFRRLASAAYPVVLLLCAALSFTALTAGVTGWARVWDPAAAGDPGARELLRAALSGWPVWQGALDYALSVLAIVVAGALAAGRDRGWATRLLVLAMIGSAGAFNLHAHAVATAVESALGLRLGAVHQLLFPAVVVAAYLLALLVFPPEREPRVGRAGLVVAGTLALAGLGAAVLPHTVTCVVFLGFIGPVLGVLVLPRQIRGAPTPTARTQARLLFTVVAVSSAIVTVLAVISAVMWTTGWGDLLLLVDPAAAGGAGAGQPTALLFWFARLASVATAGAVLVATRQDGDLWNAERLFSRGLAAGLTAALLGGGYVVVRNSAGLLVEGGVLPAVLTTVLAALALRPVYVRAERWTDRLLFGTRPTPYSVLAGITALSRASATDAPDLARVAEAVGRGLGAATCRLTVTRPGLGRRSYTWRDDEARDPDELVEVVVHHGAEAVGTLAVDYAAVAGLHRQRQHLLEDVADSLGVVLQASRYGIELERQLRAALAHAGEIAASRRAVVAEMDAERRRIERDLHDGAQHHLVSLRLTLGLVEHQVSTGQLDKARERLDQVADQIDMAESILAETAIGVSSPLLADMGVVRALEKELASGQPPVAVDASGAGVDDRFSHDIESAVYFCCLEAVNNARKHAEGATISVRLHAEDGRLRFTVQDDGPGWDQSRRTGTPGRGLRNVTTRISAVGGRLEVRSRPGEGTTVDGSVPLRTGSPAAQPAEPSTDTRSAPPKPDLAAPVALPLRDQVRDAVREARERYHGTEHSDALRVLAERIDAPLGLAVSGEATTDLAAALAVLDPDSAPGVGGAVLVPAESPADAFLVVLRRAAGGDVLLPDRPGVAAGHRPAHAIGALLVDGPVDTPAQRAAADCTARREVRRLCHVVVAVAPGFARAAAALSDEQYGVLQARAERDGDAPADARPARWPWRARVLAPRPRLGPRRTVTSRSGHFRSTRRSSGSPSPRSGPARPRPGRRSPRHSWREAA